MKTQAEIEEAVAALREALAENGKQILSATDRAIVNQNMILRRIHRQRLWALKWALGLFSDIEGSPEEISAAQFFEII
jgi:hypothetical protein